MRKKLLTLAVATVAASSLLTGCGGSSSNDKKAASDENITAVSREDGSGTRGAFIELFGIEQKDKDGNKVYGNPKKYNKSLEYLISDNPEDVISKRGIKLRKIFHPVFAKLLPLTSQNKLKIVKDGFGEYEIPKDKKIIYVASHGFKDDVALSLMAAKYHAYMVFASIPDFFYTIDGYALWANGVFLMDRKDEASKKALLSKVEYGFEQGLKRVIICPEGVWNKDPNEVILDLWKGSYLAAKENDALIVPISLLNKDMRLDGDRSNNKKGTFFLKRSFNY